MSIRTGGRAAASITQPLDAEVFVAGAWEPGAVLGWRHDESGGCEAEVRVHLGGEVLIRWVDLGAVRLPEARPEVIAPLAVAPHRVAPPTVAVPRVAPDRGAPSPAETVMMSRSELRGLLASGVPAASGRRRRHAADLTAEFPTVRCGEADAGRHRAPSLAPGAPAGRHRAADDTGQLVAVPAPRSGGSQTDRWTRPIGMDDVSGRPWSGSPV